MRRLAVIAVVLPVVLLLGVAQLVLPGIAAQRLRDQLAAHGTVLSVQVHAFPAIELLWHHADHVVIRMGRYRSPPANLNGMVGQAGEVGSIDASAAELQSGLLTVRDASLRKRGDVLSVNARVAESDLRAALPFLSNVQPIASGGGRLILRGTATLLGLSAVVDATVAAQAGRLVVQPNVPFGALATVTVFASPAVDVQGVSATAAQAGSFSVAAQGRLR
jgi:hypothetical protein